MIGIKDVLADFLGMTDELAEVGMTFGQDFANNVADNMDIVYNALSGNLQAGLEISKWATEDIAQQLIDGWQEAGKITDEQAANLQTQLQDYLSYFQYLLDNDQLRFGPIEDQEFLTSLENMVNSLGLAEADARKAMSALSAALGMDVEYDYENEEAEHMQYDWIPASGYSTDSENVGLNNTDTFT